MSKTCQIKGSNKFRACLERNGKCFYPECSCSFSTTSAMAETLGISMLCATPLRTTTRRVSVRVGRDLEGVSDGTR